MRSHLLIVVLCALALPPIAEGGDCVKDLVGNPLCAPPQGSIVRTIDGPACALGACVKDAKGQWQCSNITGGAATRGLTGGIMCQGGCAPPRRELCVDLGK